MQYAPAPSQPWDPATGAPAPRKAGPPLWTAVAAMGGGLFLVAVSIVLVCWPVFFGLLSAEPFPIPAVRQMHLDPGVYEIYERTARVEIFGASVTPDTVTVVGANGSTLLTTVHEDRDKDISTYDGDYSAVVEFVVHERGDYTVTIDTPDPSDAFVTRKWEEQFAFGWLALTALGGIVFVAGGGLLIVGMIRRGRAS